jgi:hypothetical protein
LEPVGTGVELKPHLSIKPAYKRKVRMIERGGRGESSGQEADRKTWKIRGNNSGACLYH